MINNLHVSRFRSFQDLRVEGFGRVNLVTGRNNVGKSTLLEAVRLWATEGSVATFQSILNYREENTQPVDEEGTDTTGPDDFFAYGSLFRGFPTLANCEEGFTISCENSAPVSDLSVRIGRFVMEQDEQGTKRLTPASADLFTEGIGSYYLEIDSLVGRRRLRLDNLRKTRRVFPGSIEFTLVPCLFVDPFSSRSTRQLANLWDKVVLTDNADAVVRALQIISGDILAVSMIADPLERSRTAIAKSASYDHPVPLKSFGDGVNRLFSLILSLTCARGGYLLVDEIENGLHHTILTDAWRTIFKLALDLEVQVFATTHSRDCIEAFQKAAEESPEDGVLVRLTRKGDAVIPTVLREEQLRIITADQIEVR